MSQEKSMQKHTCKKGFFFPLNLHACCDIVLDSSQANVEQQWHITSFVCITCEGKSSLWHRSHFFLWYRYSLLPSVDVHCVSLSSFVNFCLANNEWFFEKNGFADHTGWWSSEWGKWKKGKGAVPEIARDGNYFLEWFYFERIASDGQGYFVLLAHTFGCLMWLPYR